LRRGLREQEPKHVPGEDCACSSADPFAISDGQGLT